MLGDLRAVPRGGRLPAAPRERTVLGGGSSQVPLMALTEGSVADSRLAGNRHRQEFRAEDVQTQPFKSDPEETSVLLLGWGRVHLQS